MKIAEIVAFLDQKIPKSLQESYDNVGLLCGRPELEITGVLVCLDITEEVLEEAISLNFNLIVCHHPLIFSGLKKITGKSYVERIVLKAIESKVCIYAAHTNLDNLDWGVNKKICYKLGLINTRILDGKAGLMSKLTVFVPKTDAEKVRNALFDAGAGNIGNYSEASFNSAGIGTFLPNENANPTIGKSGILESVEETKIEVLVENHKINDVLKNMTISHPYEEVAYYLAPISNVNPLIGCGMVGSFEKPVLFNDLLTQIKKTFGAKSIKYTKPTKVEIKTVAVCGGSGSFLTQAAIAAKADIFITSDLKYHQFFDADNRIILCDIGHYESEQFTSEILCRIISENYTTFAVRISGINTNPVHYY